ncbi:MAG TPA: caspase family protein [Blastocatellia bacterium]|nr:caspase family protein [Blastocatellia bacterium]
MKPVARSRRVSLLLLLSVTLSQFVVAVRAGSTKPAAASQANPAAGKPEIVLQAGITVPQAQIDFSPDGRLLASMGVDGSTIKLWEIASGRLLRQIETGVSAMGTSFLSRPFTFSADGRTLIGVADGRVKRWDVETGRDLNATPLTAVKDYYTALLSEDARVFAAISMDNTTARMWETATGRELRSVAFDNEENLAAQDSIALSPDGSMLASLTETVKGSRKGIETKLQLTLWETATGRKAQTLKVQAAPLALGELRNVKLAFSADGKWLALRDTEALKVWEAASGRELNSYAAAKNLKSSDSTFTQIESRFAFSPDKRLVSIVSENGTTRLIDLASGSAGRTLAGHKGVVAAIGFSPEGRLVATSATDGQIKLWDAATGNEVRTLSGSAMPINDVAFSRDGRSLVLGGSRAASLWELATGGVRRAVALPDEYAVGGWSGVPSSNGTLSRDGRLMISGSGSEAIAKVWDVTTGREVQTVSLPQGKELGSAAFSSDGTLLALVEKDKKKTQQPSQLPSAQPRPEQPAISPGAGAMPDMTKMMEEMRKDPKKAQEQMKKMMEQAKKAQEAMQKGDMSALGTMMESMGMAVPGALKAGPPNNLRIIDVSTGSQIQTIPVKAGLFGQISDSPFTVAALSFSPDGRVLASTSGFGAPITLRDAKTGQELRALKTPLSMSVYSVAWSPDGRRLASAHWGTKRDFNDPNAADSFSMDDMTFSIKLWDTQTGSELSNLAGHNNFVNALTFSRDGRVLASGSYDNTVKLWDTSTGRQLHTLAGHTGPVSGIDFSSDGRFVVSGSDDGSARLWSAESGALVATLVSLNKGDDWLVVTPDGLFDGSPGGWGQILWRFSPNTFDVSPVEIFFSEYFYPGLLPDLLAGKKPRVASDVSQKDRRQPKLTVSLGDGQSAANISTREVKVKVNITEAPAGARDVRLFRNGSLVRAWRGDVLKGQTGATLETTVSMVAGQNQFTAYAFNRDNVKSADAVLDASGHESLKRAGTLHLLAVGINQYANAAYNLKYAVADVRAVAEELERQQKKLGLYSQVQLTSLTDNEATKANILYALKRLAGSRDAALPQGAPAQLEKIKPAEPEDAVIIYYAGHGTAQDQRFYLIPHDLGHQGARTELDEAGLQKILSHSISDLELEQAFESIDAGQTLMVIDACNSGQALEAEEKRRGPMNSKGLAQLAYEKGMYILTAAQSYQAALEAEQLGHGYLTYALVEEGLKTAAADYRPKDNQVMVREWLDYATERVPRMQETKMKESRDLKHNVAFVEGEEKVEEVDKRSLQRPRVFYRREMETKPMIVARP